MLQLCIRQNFRLPAGIWNMRANNVCSALRRQNMHRRRDPVAVTVGDFIEYH